MKLAKLTVDLRLHGCRSLKDKRQRLRKLKDKFGKNTTLAVCESDYQDSHQLGQWTFVSCGGSATVIEQTLSEVEQYVAYSVDAEVVGLQRTWL